MVKRLFTFFIYSNLFMATCAVVMVQQTYSLLLRGDPNIYFLLFVFFSTLCSYSFHWYLTSHSVIPSPRIQWVQRNRNIHLLLFFTGLSGAAVFFCFLLPYWYWLLLSAAITFLYSAPKIPNVYFRALRRVALGKTIFLAMVWTYVTTILPLIISPQSWKNDFIFFTGSRFSLIYAICILFDCRDREDDKAAGIRSLITFLDQRSIYILFAFSLIIFGTATGCLLLYGYPVLTVCILLLPGVITACLFNYSQRNFSDSFYYFVLDGLMAFSALLMLIPGI
jgi:1,4-dihydroxy-2-naphthoate octaprenyltransferase